jgi:hypothetical protein
MIVQFPLITRSLNLKSSIYALLASGVISGLLASAPLFGWSKYTLEGSLISCSIEWKSKNENVSSYNIFIFIITFFLPSISLIVTNCKIVVMVR